MKLITRTYIGTLLLSIPIIIIGSIFSFYIIRYINYEETDEYLSYEMEHIIQYYNEHGVLSEYNNIEEVLPNVSYEYPIFKDTLILQTGDNEYVPFRELFFTIEHKGEHHTIVLRHLLMGYDDIFEGTLLIISGVIMLIILLQVLMIQLINRSLWQPFYSTLSKLQTFKIDQPVPVFSVTKIDEFNAMNTSLQSLLEKSARDYRSNKEFNENASHELQTHLAVIRAKTEQLINKSGGNTKELQEIYHAANRLSQIQKSLLLLSKISNSEFTKNESVNLKDSVVHVLDTYEEAFQIRNISLSKELDDCEVFIHPGLAEILMNNLIKNTIKHNIENGYVRIKLSSKQVIIENSGLCYEGNPHELFQRFTKGQSGVTGIGLAIIKQICDIYHFQISYTISEETKHKITLVF